MPVAVAQRESAEDAAAAAEMETVTDSRARGQSAAGVSGAGGGAGPGARPWRPTCSKAPIPPTTRSRRTARIRVAADETLGHYADWLAIPTASLRTLNHLKPKQPVLIGERIRLDLRKVPRETFEQRRREYHRALQASYFASHRIVGTEVYIARPGDSLWTLTQRGAQLPLWLLQQYNPDVDLAELHPGVQLAIPRVEQVGNGG